MTHTGKVDPGTKYDDGKDRWDALPIGPMKLVIGVLNFGIKKYALDNWQHVKEPQRRYYAAAMRHITSWKEGERFDPDSGLQHLAHATACLIFLLWFDNPPAVSK